MDDLQEDVKQYKMSITGHDPEDLMSNSTGTSNHMVRLKKFTIW